MLIFPNLFLEWNWEGITRCCLRSGCEPNIQLLELMSSTKRKFQSPHGARPLSRWLYGGCISSNNQQAISTVPPVWSLHTAAAAISPETQGEISSHLAVLSLRKLVEHTSPPLLSTKSLAQSLTHLAATQATTYTHSTNSARNPPRGAGN